MDTNAIRGSRADTPATTAAKSPIMGSISGEWNACETASCRTRAPPAASRSATTFTAGSEPESTSDRGPLTAAMPTSPVSSGATSASVAVTAIITPPGGNCAINRPRAATSRAASDSESARATQAAATSPTEWPITTSGVAPRDSHSAATAISSANSAGWANSVLCNNSASEPHITSRNGSRQWVSTAVTASSKARANTGKRSYKAAPMPSHCEP